MTEKFALKIEACVEDYSDCISSRTVFAGDVQIGDLVNFDCRTPAEFATAWAVILTFAMRPYSNARFATREGALNYMALVAHAHRQIEVEAA